MNEEAELLIYKNMEESGSVNVILKNNDIWATQVAMTELFGVDRSSISKHIRNIYSEGELERNSTIAKIAIVQTEGDRVIKREIDHYSLDMIISVGYRVNSQRATNFRIWATRILKEYTIKGFVLDDERLKNNSKLFNEDYFEELLERVRSIRASERRIWQKITDIFAECSIDYNRDSPTTKNFYAMVQNKFHYAITGKTAAELIFDRADHTSENMGLMTWKNAPDGMIRKSDVRVAKNYLTEKQIRQLERSVSGFFDYIEDLIERGHTFTMDEFAESVNKFLEFREYKILEGKGSVSGAQALHKAETEYDIFKNNQKYISDFDRHVKKLENNRK